MSKGLRAYHAFLSKHKRKGKTHKQAHKLWKSAKHAHVKSRKGKGKSRKGHRSIESFGGMESYLTRLIGAKKGKTPVLRPSDSLAQRKAKLSKLISMMGEGVDVLKNREAEEDFTAAQYTAHKAEIKRLVDMQRAAEAAWRESRKPYHPTTSAKTYGPMGSGQWVSGDKGKKKHPKKGKKKHPKKGKKKHPKKGSSAGLRAYRAFMKKHKRGGMSHKQAGHAWKKAKKSHRRP
jgi:hypothetical protein